MSATDAATYSVVVSGTCGNAVTNSASLTVNQNVVVVSGPVSLTNCPGSSASFSVSATGTGLSYQWYKDGNTLAGQTGSSLVLTNVSATDAATYSVVVSGTCGNAVTNSASLTVNQNVAVVSGPVSVTNCPGTSASFSVSATGTGLSYQWYKGATAMAGQTGSSLVLSQCERYGCGDLQRGGQRDVRQRGDQQRQPDGEPERGGGQRAGERDQLSGDQRQLQRERDGDRTELSVVFGRQCAGGPDGQQPVLNSVSATDAGTYSVVVSGVCGSPVSQQRHPDGESRPWWWPARRSSVTNCPGTSASFSVSATGTGLSYQWYNGTQRAGGSDQQQPGVEQCERRRMRAPTAWW